MTHSFRLSINLISTDFIDSYRMKNLFICSSFVIMYKIKGFREKVICVIVSTFLIFMFADQLLLVDVFS